MKRWLAMLDWRRKPPEWRTLRLLNIVMAAICLILGTIPPINWGSMVDLFVSGFLFAAAMHAHMQHRMAEVRDMLIEANQQAMEIIKQLIDERTEMIMAADGSPPIQPTRH